MLKAVASDIVEPTQTRERVTYQSCGQYGQRQVLWQRKTGIEEDVYGGVTEKSAKGNRSDASSETHLISPFVAMWHRSISS